MGEKDTKKEIKKVKKSLRLEVVNRPTKEEAAHKIKELSVFLSDMWDYEL